MSCSTNPYFLKKNSQVPRIADLEVPLVSVSGIFQDVIIGKRDGLTDKRYASLNGQVLQPLRLPIFSSMAMRRWRRERERGRKHDALINGQGASK